VKTFDAILTCGLLSFSIITKNAILILLVSFPFFSHSQTPTLVIDFNQGKGSSAINEITTIDNKVLFSASDTGDVGVWTMFWGDVELWQCDSFKFTQSVKLTDITGDNSAIYHGANLLTKFKNEVYFRTTYSGNIWKSDGTNTGTSFVSNKCIIPNAYQGYPPIELNNYLYFMGNSGGQNQDWELWKSDGTDNGTVLVKDINTGSSGSYPINITAVSYIHNSLPLVVFFAEKNNVSFIT